MALRLAAILTLAIGLGPALAMFTIVQAALIRPLPYPEPERVVTAFTIDAKTGEQLPPATGMMADRVAAMRSFDRVARVSVAGGLVLGGSDPDNVFGSGVEAPFFQIFGMPVVLGRQAQQPNEAVISSRLWDQRFGHRVRSMLFYDVSATSPAIYSAAAAVFLTAAALATWLPLRRAWRLNPADTLRRD